MKRILLLALAISMMVGIAWGADAYRFGDTVSNSRGDVIGGATISVYFADTDSLAVLYTSPDTSYATKTNPTYTDAYGRFVFYVLPGTYDLTFTGAGISTYTLESVSIGDYGHLASADSVQSYFLMIVGNSAAIFALEDSSASYTDSFAVHRDSLDVHAGNVQGINTHLKAHSDSLDTAHTLIDGLLIDVDDRQTIGFGEIYVTTDWGSPLTVDFDADKEDSLLPGTWTFGDRVDIDQGASTRILEGFTNGKRYLLTFHLTVSAADTSTFKIGLSKSGSEVPGSASFLRITAEHVNERMAVSGSAISAMTAGSLVGIAVRSSSDATDLLIHSAYLSATELD